MARFPNVNSKYYTMTLPQMRTIVVLLTLRATAPCRIVRQVFATILRLTGNISELGSTLYAMMPSLTVKVVSAMVWASVKTTAVLLGIPNGQKGVCYDLTNNYASF